MTIPMWLQCSAAIASITGFCVSVASMVSAIFAAVQAKHANTQAFEARRAAVLLGRTSELGDRIADTKELYLLLAHQHFDGVAAKCGVLRGRIVRYKEEAMADLDEEDLSQLDIAREQLEIAGKIANNPKVAEQNRNPRIHVGLARVQEALNRIYAIRRQQMGVFEHEQRERP